MLYGNTIINNRLLCSIIFTIINLTVKNVNNISNASVILPHITFYISNIIQQHQFVAEKIRNHVFFLYYKKNKQYILQYSCQVSLNETYVCNFHKNIYFNLSVVFFLSIVMFKHQIKHYSRFRCGDVE